MAEAAEHADHAGHAEHAGTGETHAAGHEHKHEHKEGNDPLHHVKDVVLWGIDTNGGVVRYKPNDEHGHPRVFEGKVYQTKMAGPLKLEFTKHMLDVGLIAAFLVITVTALANRVLRHVRADEAPKGMLANLVEVCYTFVRDDIVKANGGHHATPYTPIFITYFMFILCSNYAGMIPEFGGATGNISVTAALGGSVLVMLTCLGIYKQGPVAYLLHMVPPSTPWWLWPGMFLIEFTGPIIKCFVLCMRLFGNMIAGHLVISNVLIMGTFGAKAPLAGGMATFMLGVGVMIALGTNMLEMLVCVLQAYVFTMLSVIFVSAAVHPEH